MDRIGTLRSGSIPAPVQIHFVISDLCNHDCSFCAYRMSGYPTSQMFLEEKDGVLRAPHRFIPLHKALSILDDAREMGIKAIQFTGGGEPTAHPDHLTIIHHCTELGLDLALVTNGSLLKERLIDELMLAKWCRISIDAGTRASYSTIRRVRDGMFDRVLSNVKDLVDAKNRNNSEILIGLGYVVTQENYGEVDKFISIASDLGVDNIRISAAFTNERFDYHKAIYPKTRELIDKAKQSHPDLKIFDLYNDRVIDLQKRPASSFCGYMYLVTYIGADMNVYRCCTTSYNQFGLLGSLRDVGLKDFWFSEDNAAKMRNFDATECVNCMFNDKNEIIEYMMGKGVDHENFI